MLLLCMRLNRSMQTDIFYFFDFKSISLLSNYLKQSSLCRGVGFDNDFVLSCCEFLVIVLWVGLVGVTDVFFLVCYLDLLSLAGRVEYIICFYLESLLGCEDLLLIA